METDKVGLHADDVNIYDLVMELAEKRYPLTGDRRVEITIEDRALTLKVDRALLFMILAQYIDNAQKYSTPGTAVEVAVSVGHNEAIFSVHNFGPTIRIEDRERVFDRFFRSTDLRESVPGTGIGLSVVRKAAQAHHGHVWVISDDREGTTFFLSMPIASRGKMR